MKTATYLSIAAGALMLGLTSAANAAPVSTGLPNLSTLPSVDTSVEQLQYWRHHRRCHWVKRCGPYRCHWVRRCW